MEEIMLKKYETTNDEPLEVIFANECETQIGSLCTSRFRRLANEIYDLNEEIKRLRSLFG